jgi:ArsR family transcriptional regulator
VGSALAQPGGRGATLDDSRLVLIPFFQFHIIGNMKAVAAIVTLSALAQESRLTVYRLLVRRGPDGYTPSQLTEKLQIPAPTLSFHLRELERAGLVDVRRNGRFLYYSPNFGHMKELVGFLMDNCCSVAERGCAPDCELPAVIATDPKRKRA